MKRIILFGLWCMLCCPVQAQQNYQETYQKARMYTNTHSDSAMLWAEKCLELATTREQKYKAYYLRGFNANKLCMQGQALDDYQNARHFAPDSVAYFRINNNLANIYLFAEKHEQAIKLNEQCIAFNTQAQQWVRLSYNYEVKSNILCEQKDEAALKALRKAVSLRKKHAPQQIGYAYESLAKAFAVFSVYDSALVYQQLAIENYPDKSEQETATLHTKLAKYLILNNQTRQALKHLQRAQPLKKVALAELFWCHTFGLYLAKAQQKQKANETFHNCDSLLQKLLDQAPDIVTQRSISQYAVTLYQDVLKLTNIQAMERNIYQHKLQVVQANLKRYATEIKLKDTLYRQKWAQTQEKNQRADHYSSSFPLRYWLLILFTVAMLVAWGIWRFTQVKQAWLTPAEYANMLESKLLAHLETNVERRLTSHERYLVLEYYRGRSYADLAKEFGVARSTLVSRYNAVLKGSEHTTIAALIKNFRQAQRKPEKFKVLLEM